MLHCVTCCVSAPDISDQQVLLFLLLQQTGEVLPHMQCVALQILFLNHV